MEEREYNIGPNKKKALLQIFDEQDELLGRAAEIFIEAAADEVRKKEIFTVALSGGSTPAGLYEILARPRVSWDIAWGKTHLFWGDERRVERTHPDSNYRLVHDTLLTKIEIPPENIHPMPGDMKKGGATMYDEEIRNFFSVHEALRYIFMPTFDLIFLGLGKDGHTMSLYPGIDLTGHERNLVIEVNAHGFKIPHRFSMTLPLVSHASRLVFLVSGKDKAGALKDTLEGPYDPKQRPAQGVVPENGELIYLADREAAALLD